MLSPDQIRANVEAVERRIVGACDRASRRREEITVVAVSKTFPSPAVSAAIRAGINNVGENRVQEAREKKPLVPEQAIWHLVGHLQSNKAKDAVALFDVIQSVDSQNLAERIARFAAAAGKRQKVMIEVNLGGEEQKSGVAPPEVIKFVAALQTLDALDLLGLMAIPPAGDPESMRPYFRELCKLGDDAGLQHLSMGMTDDFDIAIEEGATIVRIGRAIFGERG